MVEPGGIGIVDESLFMANLRGARLWEIPLDALGTSTDRFTDEFGRLRDVVTAVDGSLWILTRNTDGRGQPFETDDRPLRVTLQ